MKIKLQINYDIIEWEIYAPGNHFCHLNNRMVKMLKKDFLVGYSNLTNFWKRYAKRFMIK